MEPAASSAIDDDAAPEYERSIERPFADKDAIRWRGGRQELRETAVLAGENTPRRELAIQVRVCKKRACPAHDWVGGCCDPRDRKHAAHGCTKTLQQAQTCWGVADATECTNGADARQGGDGATLTRALEHTRNTRPEKAKGIFWTRSAVFPIFADFSAS